MQTRSLNLLILVGISIIAFLIGCTNEKTDPLDYNKPVYAPIPEITSISPADSALAVKNDLTITGKYFSAVKDENLVYFDYTPALIRSATTTQLVVQAPNLIGDTIKIRIATRHSPDYSIPKKYKLITPIPPAVDSLEDSEEVLSVTCDNAGNTYAGMVRGANWYLVRITPDRKRTNVFYQASGAARLIALKIGPNNKLYAIRRGIAAILYFNLPTSSQNIHGYLTGTDFASDLDFDVNKNIWVSFSSGNKVVRIKNSPSLFPPTAVSYISLVGVPLSGGDSILTANMKSIRVYSSKIYIAGTILSRKTADSLTTEGVWSIDISGDTLNLTTITKYFDLKTMYTAAGYFIKAITFASDGTMFVGIDAPDAAGITDGLLTVDATGTGSVFIKPLVNSDITSLGFGPGTYLYATRSVNASAGAPWKNQIRLYRINTEKTTATYYGW